MYLVDEALCNGCGICLDLCPTGAIHVENEVAVIDQKLCSECGHCFDGCLRNAVFELNHPAEALEPARMASAGRPARAGSHAGTVPGPVSGFRSTAVREKAGTVMVAAFPVLLKLAGALADYLSMRASRMPGLGGGGIPASRNMGAGHQGRHRRHGF